MSFQINSLKKKKKQPSADLLQLYGRYYLHCIYKDFSVDLAFCLPSILTA